MLHTQFRGNRPAGSGPYHTIYGHGGHLGECEWTDDRRTPDPWVSYKLTGEPLAQVS